MSIATQLKEESRMEGQIEGGTEIAKRMIDEGSDLNFVVRVTGLSLEQIKKLQKH
jgi:predicted transposase/invertase (TIGR01784 family)